MPAPGEIRGEPVYDGHLTNINNANGEAETRNALRLVGRDHWLTEPQRDELLQHGRAKLGLMAVAALGPQEHYSKRGLTKLEPGKGGGGSGSTPATEPASSPVAVVRGAPAPQTATDLVELEAVPYEALPASPRFDAVKIGKAVQEWTDLANRIERTVPGCITQIQGKPWRNSEFWRVARLAYGVDRPMMTQERIDYAAGRAEIHIRCSLGPRSATAIGIAERAEKGKADAPMNTIVSLAYTRGINRASREVIGLGSKSAEEVE